MDVDGANLWQRALSRIPAPAAIFATGKGLAKPLGVATGFADLEGRRPFTAETPVRIASNTKTFVAATALRLWERGQLDLDTPVAALLTPALTELLQTAGYETGEITVRHLLSHSAGIFDHTGTERFTDVIHEAQDHVWTREEQVRLSCVSSGPTASPGVEFRYSDTGYILLGDILERVSGRPLAFLVRQEMRFDELGMTSAWWEKEEPAPAGIAPRARQFIGKEEFTALDASADLFGGGGLAMNVRDLARFMAHLFEARIFQRPETVAEMLSAGTHKGAEEYRLGLFSRFVGEVEVFTHAGFWGTLACYSPDSGVAVAGCTLDKEYFGELERIVEEFLLAVA
ncbi:serine hydrolase domain-containing protein [Ciceribacter ferrooxidans]|uniref:Class A beta-lactamase-related serine hydrolase n=1 Tax=Ciceribacter ferrooxidans TaxID=2509717 RepID=A0A4Q2TEW7_9HYPH|nr:serine hydrolase domain-containing protein [Ciceribacter ferrooxidans]RYC17883.1 class A beta-lactamase-related serine hydrolase [Ciceribacter ferrooxidans]